MSDEGHLLNGLKPHHSSQLASFFISPECHAVVNLVVKLFPGHIRFFPAIFRDNPPVGLSSFMND
jgi:hypothetical protein